MDAAALPDLMRAPGTRFEGGDVRDKLIAGSGFDAAEPGLRLLHERIDVFDTLNDRRDTGQQTLQPEQATVLDFYLHAVRHAEQIVLHPEGRECRGLHAVKELFAAGMRGHSGAIDLGAATADNFLGVHAAELMADEWRAKRALVFFHQ